MKTREWTKDALLTRFRIIDSLYWISLAGFVTLVIAYARSKGVTATQVGLMVAGYRVASFCGQLFWGTMTDRKQQNRRYVMLMFTVLSAAFFCLYGARTWAAIFVCYTVVGFVHLPLNTNLDTWIIRSFGGDSSMLPRVRSAGSLAYAVMLLAFALAVNRIGWWPMPASLGVFGALTLALVFVTRPPNAASAAPSRRFSAADAVRLFKIPGFGFCELVLFVLCLGVLTLWVMVTLVIEYAGGTAADVSYHAFLMTLLEAPGLLIAGRLAFRMKDEHRLMIAIVFGAAETVGILLARSPLAAVLTGIPAGVSYSFFFASMRSMVQKIVPPELATTAHGVNDAICMSTAGCIGSLCGGVLMDAVGVPVFLTICLALEAASFVLLLVYMRTEPARAARRANFRI